MSLDPVSAVLDIGGKLIDRLSRCLWLAGSALLGLVRSGVPGATQSFFSRYTTSNPQVKSCIWQTNCCRPFSNRLCLPERSNSDGISAIVALFYHVNPTAIPGLVIAINIDAINRHASWLLSHIAQEILKRLPTLTHSDPAATVIFVGCHRWCFAALFHTRPHFPSLRKFSTLRVAVPLCGH